MMRMFDEISLQFLRDHTSVDFFLAILLPKTEIIALSSVYVSTWNDTSLLDLV